MIKNSDLLRDKKIYLSHITHIKNLPSILENGLLSKNSLCTQKIEIEDISDPNVQDLRSDKYLDGVPLHDYVPLYISIPNPMLCMRQDIQNDLMIIAIDSKILDSEKDIVCSDGNAASRKTQFYRGRFALMNMNWPVLEDRSWLKYEDGKRIKCAEVLVHDSIETDYFKFFVLRSSKNVRFIQSLFREYRFEIRVSPKHFF